MAFIWVNLEVRGVEMLMLHLPGSTPLLATNQAAGQPLQCLGSSYSTTHRRHVSIFVAELKGCRAASPSWRLCELATGARCFLVAK
jgi:hypothetical protein